MQIGAWYAPMIPHNVLYSKIDEFSRSERIYFRIRSSKSIERCNRYEPKGCMHTGVNIYAGLHYFSLTKNNAPDRLKCGWRNFRCIHSVYQSSLGKGERSASVLFNWCMARFDAQVEHVAAPSEPAPWAIIVKNEWRTHTYGPEETLNYRGVNDLPQDIPRIGNVAALADANVSSRSIANYVSGELDE